MSGQDVNEPDVETTVRALLRFCTEQASDEDALPGLVAARDALTTRAWRTELAPAVGAVVQATLAHDVLTPGDHAHLVMLFVWLFDMPAARDATDGWLGTWIRHPSSFGPGHVTPLEFQREAWVQRLADLVGWNTLDTRKDHDALLRYLKWLDSWAPSSRKRIRRSIDTMRRNFPARDLWDIVRPW